MLGLTRLLLASGMLGCGSLVDLEDFDPIPPLSDLDLTAVNPALPCEYWELREGFGGPPDPDSRDRVIGRSGSRQELDLEVVAALDTLHLQHGVGNRCLPGYCFLYIASVRESEIEVWSSAAAWAVFFGVIDRPEEAVLLAAAHDYYWGGAKETGAIKAVADGYELVVLKTVRFCDSVQVDRFVLHVSASGAVTVKDSEVWSKEGGVCI
ncbi:MAG: hypothetical protein JSU87_07905 [Gemmatimonadota bacterium]|nr:MAG: hypothetical protein JSU87_07905 [Gemmatimonadota bacterium]